jgi:hypothetical protein
MKKIKKHDGVLSVVSLTFTQEFQHSEWGWVKPFFALLTFNGEEFHIQGDSCKDGLFVGSAQLDRLMTLVYPDKEFRGMPGENRQKYRDSLCKEIRKLIKERDENSSGVVSCL